MFNIVFFCFRLCRFYNILVLLLTLFIEFELNYCLDDETAGKILSEQNISGGEEAWTLETRRNSLVRFHVVTSQKEGLAQPSFSYLQRVTSVSAIYHSQDGWFKIEIFIRMKFLMINYNLRFYFNIYSLSEKYMGNYHPQKMFQYFVIIMRP